MKIKNLITLLLVIALTSCINMVKQESASTEDCDNELWCCGEIQDVDVLAIVPDETVSKKELNNLRSQIEKHKDMFLGKKWDYVFIATSVRLDKFKTSRVRADSVLHYATSDTVKELLQNNLVSLGGEFSWRAGSEYNRIARSGFVNEIPVPRNIVYLTHKDICVPYKGHEEWGVLGLSLLGKRVSIVSTYRLKNKKDLWKLVAHEYNHSQGLPHCTSGDIHCIMQDAKGHPKFHQEYRLCDECRAKLK